MDAVFQSSSSPLNRFNLYNHHSKPPTMNQDHADTYNSNPGDTSSPVQSNATSSGSSSDPEDVTQNPDYFEGVLNYMNQMLMEEDDLQVKPCMFLEGLALQAAEKSFYDALIDNITISDPSDQSSPTLRAVEQWLMDSPKNCYYQALPSSSSSNSQVTSISKEDKGVSTNYAQGVNEIDNSSSTSRGKRSTNRDNSDGGQQERNTKQLACYSESQDDSELMDRVLLSPDINPHLPRDKPEKIKKKGSLDGRMRGRKMVDLSKDIVDLMSLLTLCGQALASGDLSSSHELLRKIKQHSSPYGNSTERLAHYFGKAIDARLAGTGADIYGGFTARNIPATQTLRSYHMYMTSSPFHKMSNIVADKTIIASASGKDKLHIIHFGILYGFQWPCFIQNLSLRPGGPPKLRITGIDFPQPGFRPKERVEDTGRRLENYCKRFNVPFEFNAIAKKWETIQIEELKLESDEFVVVNSIYRLHNVPDETVVESSPRDTVLNLIKKVNPDLFIHGVTNGTYNAPFFLTRFRDALFHFTALYDMLEAAAPREDSNRLLFEQEFYGREVLNVIACEGTSRIERPETYKQWQARIIRAGFKQIPLAQDIVKEVRAKVKLNYHKDFLVDEDCNWMLQGWKGKVLCAISVWKPVQ